MRKRLESMIDEVKKDPKSIPVSMLLGHEIDWSYLSLGLSLGSLYRSSLLFLKSLRASLVIL
jgi:hypothetical protein